MKEIIEAAISRRATDLHIQEGQSPMLRIQQELVGCPDYSVAWEMIFSWLESLGWQHDPDCALSSDWRDGIRLRIQLAKVYTGFYLDIRILYPLSQLPPDDDEELLQSLSRLPDGLILFCGPTGSGKTTAMWRMLSYMNDHFRRHIITLEDPIEIVLAGNQSLVTQRELGKHFSDFAQAVRQALRQDPDVILIGEMRDKDTMEAALTAAETGHLVLSTLHTRSAAQAVTRFVGAFREAQQGEARYRFSMVIQAVLSQQRLCKAGRTKILREVLLRTPAVAQLIRNGKEHQLGTVMQMGAAVGMRTLEQARAQWSRNP